MVSLRDKAISICWIKMRKRFNENVPLETLDAAMNHDS